MHTKMTAGRASENQSGRSGPQMSRGAQVTSVQYASPTDQALSDLGAPLSVIAPYTSARPFLEMLSGRDPLRVVRAGVANGGHDWLPYGWAR